MAQFRSRPGLSIGYFQLGVEPTDRELIMVRAEYILLRDEFKAEYMAKNIDKISAFERETFHLWKELTVNFDKDGMYETDRADIAEALRRWQGFEKIEEIEGA